MFGWIFGDRHKQLQEKTEKSFSAVKHDIGKLSKWIEHLDGQDKQLFDVVSMLKEELSSIKGDIGSLREGVEIAIEGVQAKRTFKKLPVGDKQTAVYGVQNAVQTAVQTGNFYEILKGFSSNERLIIMTLANNPMKLSYEDLASLLGKERATIRGQINGIKQKSEGLIEEIIEKNGKKRIFVRDYVRERLAKYAKVRVKKNNLHEKDKEKEENREEENI